MGNRNNVIDFNARKTGKEARKTDLKVTKPAQILDMTERRQIALQEERRAVRRTILTEFIGAFVVLPGHGLKKVSLYDISEKGVSFDLEFELGQLRVGEEVAMRVYLSQFTYFPFSASVTNVREVPDEGIVRHGANFVKETVNEEALHHFVRFIESVSVDLHRDNGDFQKHYRR